ncbi:hypothetical protein ACOTHJ_13685 [Achromobacter xylosoxidans]
MKQAIQWHVLDKSTGAILMVLTSGAQYREKAAILASSEVIRPVTSPDDEFPPAHAPCTVAEWLTYQIRSEQSHYAASWARRDHAETGRAGRHISKLLDQLQRLAEAGESATAANPPVDGEPTVRELALTSALAKCRDAFPHPPVGSDLEQALSHAVGDPESVPDYIQAIADDLDNQAQAQYEATDEKEAFSKVFSPEYLAHREAKGVADLTEFAFSVWCQARLPVKSLLAQPSRNDILLTAIAALLAFDQNAAADRLRLMLDPMPAPFMRDPDNFRGLLDGFHALIGAGLASEPPVGSTWRHKNGNRYTVFAILNKDSDRQDEYPTSVAYVGDNGKTWVRPLHRWHSSMTLVSAPLPSA